MITTARAAVNSLISMTKKKKRGLDHRDVCDRDDDDIRSRFILSI